MECHIYNIFDVFIVRDVMYQQNFVKLAQVIAVYMLLSVIVLSLSRTIFLYNIVNFEQLALYQHDLFKVFFWGGTL